MARRLGVDRVVDYKKGDPVAAIREITQGRGVDVSIEALGQQQTFENALRVLRPGGTCRASESTRPTCAFPWMRSRQGLATTRSSPRYVPAARSACDVSWMSSPRVAPISGALVTHRFKLDQIEEAYELFSHQGDGVLKVAITP